MITAKDWNKADTYSRADWLKMLGYDACTACWTALKSWSKLPKYIKELLIKGLGRMR